MAPEPYRSADRVFWVVDNGSSHRGQAAVRRLMEAYTNAIVVHTPVHASWLNYVEIYFSLHQRKVLTPNDFASGAGPLAASTSVAPFQLLPIVFPEGYAIVVGRCLDVGERQVTFATLIMVAISAGLLLGLGLGGVTLPVTEAGRAIPLALDALAAGIAAASFAIFFSTPRNLLGWTVAIAIVAHIVRWVLMTFAGLSIAGAALVACAIAGALVTPIAHRLHAPFAGVGYAAVVSMIPGIFIFRTASGLIHLLGQGVSASSVLVAGTLSNAIMATAVSLAMGIGLVTSRRIVTSGKIARFWGVGQKTSS